MRTNWQSYPVSFSGGLITNLGLLEQGGTAPGSARELSNFEPSLGGGYRKVLGYRKYPAVAVPGTLSDKILLTCLAAEDTIITFRDKTFYLHTVGDTAWESKLTVANKPTQKIRFVKYNFGQGDKIVFVDGVNIPVFYDVQTETFSQPVLDATSADIEGSQFVASFAQRLFFAKGSVMTFSNLLTEDDFDPALGAGVLSVKDDITGMISFRNQLVIFGEDRIDYLTGNTQEDFNIQAITRKTGCSWPESIQEVGGDILYKAPDGIRYLSATEKNDDFALSRASENIQDLITEDYAGADEVSSLVIRTKNQYRVFYYNPSSSINFSKGFLCTRMADQTSDSASTSWSLLAGFNVYVSDSDQFQAEEIVIFSDGASYVYQMEWGYDFDGENIPFVFSTPYFVMEDPRVRKTFYKHHCYILPEGSYGIQTNLTLNFGDSDAIQPPQGLLQEVDNTSGLYGYAVYGTSSYGGVSRTEVTENLVGSGFSGSMTYQGNDTYPSFTLSSLVLQFRYNDRK